MGATPELEETHFFLGFRRMKNLVRLLFRFPDPGGKTLETPYTLASFSNDLVTPNFIWD
jgi:hypothetical protein